MGRKNGVEKWKTLIEEQQNSGLSIREWCQQHQIDKTRYYYWRRRIQSQEQEKDEIQFAELSLSTAPVKSRERYDQDISAKIQIRYHGFEIAIPQNTSSPPMTSVLEAVLSVLQKVC